MHTFGSRPKKSSRYAPFTFFGDPVFLGCWSKKQTESLMAKGYDEMAEEDKAFADVTFEAQREILK